MCDECACVCSWFILSFLKQPAASSIISAVCVCVCASIVESLSEECNNAFIKCTDLFSHRALTMSEEEITFFSSARHS